MTTNILRHTLNVKKLGGYIHDQARAKLRATPTEPTIVEMIFTSGTHYVCNRPFFVEGPLDEAIQCYTTMLKDHDWTYAFSDDNRAYQGGDAQFREIVYARNVLQDRGFDAMALFEEYRPKFD